MLYLLCMFLKFIKKINIKYLILIFILILFCILFFIIKSQKNLPILLLNQNILDINNLIVPDDNFILFNKNKFKQIVIEKNVKTAIDTLKKETEIDVQVLAICHDILHQIGHTSFHKYKNLTQVLLFQDDFCNSGYLHGVFEEYFTSSNDAIKELPKVCEKTFSRKFDHWQCYHGMGHGLMYFTGGDLDKSLVLCKDMLNTEENKNYCYNGVYMEIFNTQILAKEINFVDKNDPSLICFNRNIDKESCYFYLPTYFNQTLNITYINIFEKCNELVESKYKKICISGVGSEALKRNSDKVKEVFNLCRQASGYFNEIACVYGMVGISLNQNASIEAAQKLCKEAPIIYRFSCNKKVKKFNYLF